MSKCQSCINAKATHGYKGGDKLYCKECAKNVENVGILTRKSCKEETCWSEPNYNYPDVKPGIYCTKHKLAGMVDVKHPKCIYIDEDGIKCEKNPTYGPTAEEYPWFCKPHSEIFDDMVLAVTHNLCKYKDEDGNCCQTRAGWNTPGKKIGKFCEKHKRPGDEFVLSYNKCQFDGCKTTAIYNYLLEKKGIFCKVHKKEFMFNLADSRCSICCEIFIQTTNDEEKRKLQVKMGTHAGEDGERKYCAEHAEDGMKNTRAKLCEYDGCTTQASWNDEGKKARKFCAIHADRSTMDNVKNPKCQRCGYKEALYNYLGETKRIYCGKCKDSGMENLSKKWCKNKQKIDGKVVQCTTTGNPKYEGFCSRCYINLFPDTIITINYRTKEFAVCDFIKENFPDIDITYDKVVKNGISKRRPDMCIYMDCYNIIIEVDENQHSDYEDENIRLMDLFKDLKEKPLVIIRFNPDGYINNKNVRIKSCWTYNKEGFAIIDENKQQEWKNRLLKLRKRVDYYLDNAPKKEIEVEYLYYDEITPAEKKNETKSFNLMTNANDGL